MVYTDVVHVKSRTKKLLFSVAELADAVNEIGKDKSNYKVADLVFRLHRPLRQFQTQLHILCDNHNHTFAQIEDPSFPTLEGWKDSDRLHLKEVISKLEGLFDAVNADVKAVCCMDYVHSTPIMASWRVLNDFHEVLKGNPRPEYL